MHSSDLEIRARHYARQRSIEIEAQLGFGSDGSVWKTDAKTAIKVFAYQKNYDCELECYRRFEDHGVTAIRGYAVPRLAGCSYSLMVIEMDIVEPPYILDFGKVSLDKRPDYPGYVMAEWHQQLKERWGSYLPEIRAILRELERYGIYYMDPKPGNIMPENWDPPLDD